MGSGLSYLPFAAEHAASWRRLRASPEEVREYQLRALRRLMRGAVARTPYYRERFQEAGLRPEDVRSWEDFAAVPISSKADLQRAGYERRFASGAGEAALVVHETSGSTGEVLRVAQGRDEFRLYAGRRLRSLVLSGLRPWTRRVNFGTPIRRTGPHRVGLFPVDNAPLSDEPEEMMSRIERARPEILKGPPGAMEQLALQMPERFRGLGLRRIFTGAEQLSPKTRALLEEVGGVRVTDFYGAVECNLIAWECGRCGLYHTCDDSVVVELLRDGRPAGPGEEAEVVVTALHSYRMPIIRYRIGDAARVPARAAECSIRFGALERIEGRWVDYLDFGLGPPLSPYRVMDPLDEMETVRRYEIVQTDRRRLRIRVEPAWGAAADRVAREAETRCRGALPDGVETVVETVGELAVSAGTKRRYVRAYRGDG